MLSAQYDIVVIGSGPAGVAASITCVQHGLSVLLIASINSVHEERPAESVHSGILSLLSKINTEDVLSLSSVGTYQGIRTGNIVTQLGSDNNGALIGHHIDRNKFEEVLLQSAVKKKVQVVSNVTAKGLMIDDGYVVGIETNFGDIVIAKYVIDATGHRRFAGRMLRIKELFFSPPLISWTGISSEIESDNSIFTESNTHFIPNKFGWSWIAPTATNSCTWTKLLIKGKPDYLPPLILRKYPIKGNIRKANMQWRLFRPLCKEGVILCGDAAASIDPAAGQGILNALYSGVKAGETAVSVLNNPDKEILYLAQYDEWFFIHYMRRVEKLANYYNEHGIEILKAIK